MSTHCRIGRVVFPEGQVIGTPDSPGVLVHSIYVHFDGDEVGNVLKEHYTDQERIDQLISEGDTRYIEPAGWEAYDPEQPNTRVQPFQEFGGDEDDSNIYWLWVPGAGWMRKSGLFTAAGAPKWEVF